MIRDLTKSSVSFSYGMALLGVQQLTNLFTPQSPASPSHTVISTFEQVTKSTEDQLGETLKGAFRVGDKLQRTLADATFSLITLEGFNPSYVLKGISNIMKQSSDSMR